MAASAASSVSWYVSSRFCLPWLRYRGLGVVGHSEIFSRLGNDIDEREAGGCEQAVLGGSCVLGKALRRFLRFRRRRSVFVLGGGASSLRAWRLH